MYECCVFCLVLVLTPADNLTRFIDTSYDDSVWQLYGPTHDSYSVIDFDKVSCRNRCIGTLTHCEHLKEPRR
jgi:hypothetical protein